MEIWVTITISVISALVTSYFTYFFGFQQYLKQKRREEINNYYIKNGIDKVIEPLDNACFNCQFNFEKAIRIIEYLKKFPIYKESEKTLISKIFSEMQPTITAPPDALYKIQLLIGEEHKSLFLWIIEALADYLRYNDYLRYELFLELEFYFRYPEKFQGKKEEFIEVLKNRIVEINKVVIPNNEPLKVHLLNLKIRIDELGISEMKDFDEKIPKDKRIKEILKEVERDYLKYKKKNEKDKIIT